MSESASASVVEPEREVDPSDPYAREAQTFPRLSVDAADRVANYGVEQGLRKGTLVFERGQRSVDFFLVLDGNIEIFDADAGGLPQVLTVHGERQFTGELDLFNDRRILVSGRTGRDEQGRALDSAFATTAPGIFAVGDVCSGSVKRVASGVGEGSVVVQAVHGF